MTVSDLIQALKKMPKDAEVWHLWDGAARTRIEHVWFARGGYVVTADFAEPCHNDADRPAWAPTTHEEKHWESKQIT